MLTACGRILGFLGSAVFQTDSFHSGEFKTGFLPTALTATTMVATAFSCRIFSQSTTRFGTNSRRLKEQVLSPRPQQCLSNARTGSYGAEKSLYPSRRLSTFRALHGQGLPKR